MGRQVHHDPAERVHAAGPLAQGLPDPRRTCVLRPQGCLNGAWQQFVKFYKLLAGSFSAVSKPIFQVNISTTSFLERKMEK